MPCGARTKRCAKPFLGFRDAGQSRDFESVVEFNGGAARGSAVDPELFRDGFLGRFGDCRKRRHGSREIDRLQYHRGQSDLPPLWNKFCNDCKWSHCNDYSYDIWFHAQYVLRDSGYKPDIEQLVGRRS